MVDGAGDVGRGVNEVEILAAGLGDHSREFTVGFFCNSLTDFTVQRAEDVGGADEVQPGEIAVGESNVGDGFGVSSHKLHHVWRQTCLQQDLVDEAASVDIGRRRLPQHHVAHQSRTGYQISTNGGEVEGRDGVDESFKRSIVQTTTTRVSYFVSYQTEADSPPHSIAATSRLSLKDLSGKIAVQTEEVRQLSGSINFSLPDILALS